MVGFLKKFSLKPTTTEHTIDDKTDPTSGAGSSSCRSGSVQS